jgi:hypothetical protein
MTSKQFNDALAKLRLSVYASAPVLGISLRQAQRYASGEQNVAAPVANYLMVLVNMIQRWKEQRKKTIGMIDFFERTGARLGVDGKDMTKSWLNTLRGQLAEWESLLREPPSCRLPSQLD